MEKIWYFNVLTKFNYGAEKYLFSSFFVALLFVTVCSNELQICDRRPFKTNTDALSPDDRFEIEIEGLADKYIPNQQYTVRLFSKDNKTTFMGFSIWLREAEMDNEKNKRRPMRMYPGRLHADGPGVNAHQICNNTVVQTDITPKTSVQVLWSAPGKGNGYVTINAIVAIKPDVWYANEGPLSKQVYEDTRDADDMLPIRNDHCTVCEEARYQLTFAGKWSYNTHPNMFPKARDLAKFSEVVGASHSPSYTLYKDDSEASRGIKMLAEQGNTTDLESEIQKELGRSVRTVIKASAPAKTNLTTVTSFRVSKEHHFVSLATGIMPSPDWFLGVANLELCRKTRQKTSEWAPHVILNLYPSDAGTDSGKDFEASNDQTSPPQPITNLFRGPNVPSSKKKAFAQITFDLIRTYPNPSCVTENESPSLSTGEEETEESPEEDYDTIESETTPKSEQTEAPGEDQEPSEVCRVSEWGDWSVCDGPCEDGMIKGFRSRFRHHLTKSVSKYCQEKYKTYDYEECESPCEVNTEPNSNAEQRVMSPISPGQRWFNKRELKRT